MTDDGFLLTKNNYMEAERQAEKIPDRLSKLQGTFVATTPDGAVTKTIFRATRKQKSCQTSRW